MIRQSSRTSAGSTLAPLFGPTPSSSPWGGRRPGVTAVIPAMNEAENLPHVLPVVATLVDEVVLVDGRSTDDTVQVARDLIPRIRIVPQAGEGKGDALRRGFEAASGDIIVMLDADGSTDPHEIPMFVGALLAGADFAKGTRFMQGAGSADMTSIRNLGNRTFVLMVRLLFGGRYSDLCYGYNAFWADVLPELGLNSDGFEIETAMNVQALRAGLRVVEVASYEQERIHGVSNLRAIPDGWRVLRTIMGARMARRRSAMRAPALPPTLQSRTPIARRAELNGGPHLAVKTE